MFKHHGLRVRTRGPLLRDDPATTGAGGDGTAAGGGGAPVPPVVPAVPPVATLPVDITTTAEYKAAVKAVRAEAEAKARTGSKENAKNEVLEQIAVALGLKPKEVDPAAIGAELAAARATNARLITEAAVGKAARVAGGDEDMLTAWLSHKGLLKDLDPTAADFPAKVDALVKEQIEANPKLKAGTVAPAAPPVTPGRQGAAGAGTAGGAGENGRTLGLAAALEKAQRTR